MDNLELDIYDYLITATRLNATEYSVVVSKTSDKTTVDEFTLTGYKGEADMNWEKLIIENPSREAVLRQIIANLDVE